MSWENIGISSYRLIAIVAPQIYEIT